MQVLRCFILLSLAAVGGAVAHAAEAKMSTAEVAQASNALLQDLKGMGYQSYVVKIKDNKFFFETFVANEKVPMIVDTGATGCSLDEKIARKLKLPLTSAPSKVNFALDDHNKVIYQTKAPFQVGAIKFAEFPFSVFKGSKFQGIVGMRLLKPCGAVLDTRAGVLHLQEAGKGQAVLESRLKGRGYTQVPIQFSGLSPFVRVSVQGVEGLALVDSGAHYSLVDLAFLNELSLSRGRQMGNVMDAAKNQRDLFVTSPDLVTFGSYRCFPGKLGAVDLSYLRKMFTEKVIMILGADLLHENNAIVDLAGNAVFFKR